jgi:hypothetical protein
MTVLPKLELVEPVPPLVVLSFAGVPPSPPCAKTVETLPNQDGLPVFAAAVEVTVAVL